MTKVIRSDRRWPRHYHKYTVIALCIKTETDTIEVVPDLSVLSDMWRRYLLARENKWYRNFTIRVFTLGSGTVLGYYASKFSPYDHES